MTTPRPVLATHDVGSGPPLVLIHAFPLDGRMWDAQRQGLAGHHRVITPDLAGFGQSANLPATTDVNEHARDILALLDQRGLQQADVGGCSMGGYVALAVAALAPQRVRRLLLVDTKATEDTPEAKAARAAALATVATDGVEALARGMLPKLVPAHAPQAFKDAVLALAKAQGPAGVSNAIAMLRDRPDRLGLLPTLTMPTLVVVGELDAVTPLSDAQHMASALPHARLHVVPGCGHLVPMEQPQHFNDLIRRWT